MKNKIIRTFTVTLAAVLCLTAFPPPRLPVALTPTRSLCRKPPRHRRRKNPPPAAWSRRAYLLPRRAMQHWWMILWG